MAHAKSAKDANRKRAMQNLRRPVCFALEHGARPHVQHELGLEPANCFGDTGVLKFADSSAEPWTSLTISNWSGALNGGGASQLMFSTNSSGLTEQQLSCTYFVNPAGLTPGRYRAQILDTGEIVPDGRVIVPAVCPEGLVLKWFGPYTVETSANLVGPYTKLTGITSPWTNSVTQNATRFFRLGL